MSKPIKMRKATMWLVATTAVSWIAYDIPAAVWGEDGSTISAVIGDWGWEHPFMVFGGLSMLIAHFTVMGYKRRKRNK